MIVQARYKNVEPEYWFDVELTDDQRMIDMETGKEIKRTDLLFRADDEIIDMEKEWEEHEREELREDLHDLARYLALQAESYTEKYKDTK